ncbi:hypothetical protein LEP1GSC137_1008 [Leptospira borgpetersenii str. Noumea 25]|nr:hypothetical protein LEP1GSC121_0146 [Leptospira borgpetersenii serovar Castellonis str. 200801910]EMO07642.1 hypothetical protein LEP1GSC137_1008 [Leptospira borgpetersenii str. Noumea 25]
MYAEDCENGEVVFRDSYGNEPKGTFINGKLEEFCRGKFKNNGTFSGVLHKDSSRRRVTKMIDPVHKEWCIKFAKKRV